MAVFKELRISSEEDLKETMKKFHRFCRELKYTLENLDDDNFSKEYIDHRAERDDRTRELKFDADGLLVEFGDFRDGTRARFEQTEQAVSFLVERGSVADTMMSRMELYGEHIDLKSGHVTFDAQNFKLDMEGNAAFSGAIVGGTIRIGTDFYVDAEGHAVISGDLACNVLNPGLGCSVGGDVTVEGEEGYGYCTVGQELSGADAFIIGRLSCRSVHFVSDGRKKTAVVDMCHASELVKRLRPVSFHYRKSGAASMGFVAQEAEDAGKHAGMAFPLVRQCGGNRVIPYANYMAVYVQALKEQQERLARIREKKKEG